MNAYAWVGVVAFISGAFTFGMARLAHRWGWLDVPVWRSAHALPVPTGGGIVIVLTTLGALGVAGLIDVLGAPILWAVLLIAALGLWDDCRPIKAEYRFIAQWVLGAWVLQSVGGVHPVWLDGAVHSLPWIWGLELLTLTALVWFINVVNFMDGIDGLVASEILFIAVSAMVLAMWAGDREMVWIWAILAGALLGFLSQNWAPAKIFMGDVGSAYLGLLVAALFLQMWRSGTATLPMLLVLVAPFLTDATLTLARRAARKERLFEGHRLHGYQWLARRWQSHAAVTLSFLAYNGIVIGPAVWIMSIRPELEIGVLVGVYTVTASLLWLVGAGRCERELGAQVGGGEVG